MPSVIPSNTCCHERKCEQAIDNREDGDGEGDNGDECPTETTGKELSGGTKQDSMRGTGEEEND